LVKTVTGRERIERDSDIPLMRQCVNPLKVSHTAAVTVPPGRTTRRISATARLRVGYEIKHEHREGPIEEVVTERQLSCAGLSERDAPVGVASARSFRLARSQIDADWASILANSCKTQPTSITRSPSESLP
jgi:hypothetical protein